MSGLSADARRAIVAAARVRQARELALRQDSQVEEVLDRLAANPVYARAAVTRELVRAALLETDGWITAQGRVWGVVAKHLGVGVYELRLEARR